MVFRVDVSRPRSFEEYWDWYAVALFLLLTVDLLTTYGAAIEYGTQAETNPLMQWLLQQGIVTIIAINLATLIFAAIGFWGILVAIRLTSPPLDKYLAYIVELWLGLLLAGGLLIFANNMSVIIRGYSLF